MDHYTLDMIWYLGAGGVVGYLIHALIHMDKLVEWKILKEGRDRDMEMVEALAKKLAKLKNKGVDINV